jgi:hypothetical protein
MDTGSVSGGSAANNSSDFVRKLYKYDPLDALR